MIRVTLSGELEEIPENIITSAIQRLTRKYGKCHICRSSPSNRTRLSKALNDSGISRENWTQFCGYTLSPWWGLPESIPSGSGPGCMPWDYSILQLGAFILPKPRALGHSTSLVRYVAPWMRVTPVSTVKNARNHGKRFPHNPQIRLPGSPV